MNEALQSPAPIDPTPVSEGILHGPFVSTEGLTLTPNVISTDMEQYDLSIDQIDQRRHQIYAEYDYGMGKLSHEVHEANQRRLVDAAVALEVPNPIESLRKILPRTSPRPRRRSTNSGKGS